MNETSKEQTNEGAKISNDPIMVRSADEHRIDIDHKNSLFKDPGSGIMEKLHSNVELLSPVGSKRKAADDTNPRKENATVTTTAAMCTRSQDERVPATSNTTQVQNDVSLSSMLGYEDPASSTSSSTYGSRMASPKSWPIAAIDALNAASSSQGTIMCHGLPKKRQRYQRRNSFLVRRDSSLTAASLSILQDINRACFGETGEDTLENDKRPKDVVAFLKNASLSSPSAQRTTTAGEQQRRHRQQAVLREEEQLTKVGLSTSQVLANLSESSLLQSSIKAHGPVEERMNLDEGERTNDATTTWGHATWSNTEDTQWYSDFSYLSFDSTKPILPPPALSIKKDISGASGEQKHNKEDSTVTATNTSTTTSTAMLPPPPYKRYSGFSFEEPPVDKQG